MGACTTQSVPDLSSVIGAFGTRACDPQRLLREHRRRCGDHETPVARKGQPARWGADAPVDIFAQMNRQRLKPLHAVQGFFHMHFAPGFVVLRLHILSHFHFTLGHHCVLTRWGRHALGFGHHVGARH